MIGLTALAMRWLGAGALSIALALAVLIALMKPDRQPFVTQLAGIVFPAHPVSAHRHRRPRRPGGR